MKAPRLPREMLLRYTDVEEGRLRTRIQGRPTDGVLPVVVVQGMAVSDYLLPACAALADWTQVHLLDLPGLAGSGDPTRPLDVRGNAEAVAHWLEESGLGRVVLVGHSSGTQVAAWAGVLASDRVAGVVLASPTVDPKARSLPRLLLYWRLDSRFPTPGLQSLHVPEWKRAGPRALTRMVRTHLADRLEDQVARLPMPVLVIRAQQDRLSTDAWVDALVDAAPDGERVSLPGPHTFVWVGPDAWSGPIRRLAARVAG